MALDEASDTLEPPERRAALAVLQQTLAAQGREVVSAGCAEIFRVSHARLGAVISVSLRSPKGVRNAMASSIEELPKVYDQLVKALEAGVALGDRGTVNRHNVTAEQAAPRRAKADNLVLLRLGYSQVYGGDTAYGPVLGLADRFELDQVGVEGAMTLALPQDGAAADQHGFHVGLRTLYFLSGKASSSPYLGAGVSYGFLSTQQDRTEYDAYGLSGRASVGYEWLRESNVRLFVEADALLPLFEVRRLEESFDDSTLGLGVMGESTVGSSLPDSFYAWSLGLHVGMAWASGGN